MIDRRTLLGSAAALAAIPAVGQTPRRDWKALGEDVKSEMRWAWGQYRQRAWGKDEIKPISGGYNSFPLKDHHLGLSLIEAMDTLWLMGLDAEFADALAWVKSDLDFNQDGFVSVFETSIRLLGGLLSAHHACGDPVLLAKARDLADRLLPAFASPTGMPFGDVNLRTGAVRRPDTVPAEVGTYLPEWGILARLTGDKRYYDAPKKALVAMYERRSKIDLLADRIDVTTGKWLSRRATVGPPSDSYYEYLWDSWQLLGDAECKRMYDVLTRAILRHQRDVFQGQLWIADVDFETGARVSRMQNELASFYGGLLAQGGAVRDGVAVTRAWATVQDKYGVLPEGYDYGTGAIPEAMPGWSAPKANALRPELADGAFNHWLLDGRSEWRELVRTHYLTMKSANRTTYGYSGLADVSTKPMLQDDHCPGYWWSEQMKYYYLIFADTPRFDYKRNYLSTEGNVLLGFTGVRTA